MSQQQSRQNPHQNSRTPWPGNSHMKDDPSRHGSRNKHHVGPRDWGNRGNHWAGNDERANRKRLRISHMSRRIDSLKGKIARLMRAVWMLDFETKRKTLDELFSLFVSSSDANRSLQMLNEFIYQKGRTQNWWRRQRMTCSTFMAEFMAAKDFMVQRPVAQKAQRPVAQKAQRPVAKEPVPVKHMDLERVFFAKINANNKSFFSFQ